MFVILLVLCLLVTQCGCHWSQLKATHLLTFYVVVIDQHSHEVNTLRLYHERQVSLRLLRQNLHALIATAAGQL